MSLTVNVTSGEVPIVTLSGGMIGEPVYGFTTTGERWLVADKFPGYTIVDPVAPLNTSIYYECGGETSEPILRESLVFNAFTSRDGSVVVPFIIPHKWDEKVNTGLHSITTSGGGVWTIYGKQPVEGTYPVQARIAGENIPAMRSLMKSQNEFIFLHSPCPLPDCPVPPTFVAVTAETSAGVTARRDKGEMIFSLSLQRSPLAGVVAARSWWHTLNEYDSWFGVDLIGEAFK